MFDEQREKLKGVILSWLLDVGHAVGLYNIRSKDEKTLINKYCDGISRVKDSNSASEDKIGWDIILECFIESLNVSSTIEFRPNLTPKDFEDNMDTIFRSIGLSDGITNVLEATRGRNTEAKRLLDDAVARADSINQSKKWRSESLEQATYTKEKKDSDTLMSAAGVKENKNILTLQILQLPENFCSKELKCKLSGKFSFVYELLSVSFDELKRVLCDSENIPTKLLIELELFFRSHDIDFLNHIPASSKREDIIARTVISDSVTIIMTQIGKLKREEL